MSWHLKLNPLLFYSFCKITEDDSKIRVAQCNLTMVIMVLIIIFNHIGKVLIDQGITWLGIR